MSKASIAKFHKLLLVDPTVVRSCAASISSQFYKMPDKRLLLLSSSSVHGHEYLQYASKDITKFLKKSEVSRVLFIPYAQINHDEYYNKVAPVFRSWGFQLDSIHRLGDPVEAVEHAEAFFVGGGNTFLLLRALYTKDLLEALRKRVLKCGVPYMGTSAGTNVATVSIATTNDMPIVYPPSLDALNLVPFNINPHYMEPEPGSQHMGETRQERILQYLELQGAPPVLGMCEGATLLVEGHLATLKGVGNAVLYEPGMKPKEIQIGTDLSFLLKMKNRIGMNEAC